jgi:sialic acid synthase SpsE
MRPFILNDKAYSSSRVLLIAELGTSHLGDINRAKELVGAAAEAGADCAKVQIVYADEILHPNTGTVPLPGGDTKLYDVFKKLEVKIDFYAEIKAYTESKGLLFLATPFGMKSTDELFSLSPRFIKIASPELNYLQLLKKIAAYNLPVILSSGVSTLSDIECALSVFDKTPDKKNICLLHCVTAYPAPETDYNLRVLPNLSGIFGVSVGVSDHSLDPLMVPLLAIAQGAAVIEKHFCLSRGNSGLDDPIALTPNDFSAMCRALREAEKSSAPSIIENVKQLFGEEKVDAVLGSGEKKLQDSEKNNYERTNRSIHALIEIKKGDVFTENNIAILRTEKILRPGLHPKWYESILGRNAARTIPAGEGVRFEDVR